MKQHDDNLIEDLCMVCKSLILLRKTNSFEQACVPILNVWERLSIRNHLYIIDIYFVNNILFLFPLDTALEIRNFAFRSIDRYENFQKVERLKINIHANIMLLLIKNQRCTEALVEAEQAIILCKKHSDYLRLAICYVRKGICLKYLGVTGGGEQWITRGESILTAIEEINILKVLEEEINCYSITSMNE